MFAGVFGYLMIGLLAFSRGNFPTCSGAMNAHSSLPVLALMARKVPSLAP